MKTSCFNHLGFRQFCATMAGAFFLRSAICPQSPLLGGIQHVFPVGSQEKMIRPDAKRIIAGMADLQGSVKVAMRKAIAYFCGLTDLAVEEDCAVLANLPPLASNPWPATIAVTFCDAFPEPLLNRTHAVANMTGVTAKPSIGKARRDIKGLSAMRAGLFDWHSPIMSLELS